MPQFTVYALGDVNSFWTMLNGIAMFFNDNGFIQSAALAGSLVMLVLMLINVLAKAGGGSGGHSPTLGPLYLGASFILMSIPTSVVVEDIYTGSIIQVDNIPLIISLPSSMFTTGAYKIFKSADTVFQSVNGSYMSVSSNGLVTPMKLLMSMRKGLTGEAPELALSIKVFAMDCTPNSPNFVRADMESAPDAMAYMLTHANPTGLTFDFPAKSSTPVAINCNDEAAILSTRLATFLGGTTLTEGDVNKIINKNMSSMPKPDKTAYNFNTDAMLPVQNLVTSQLGASSQSAQQLMSNLIMYDAIGLGLDCAGTATNAGPAVACWTAAASERQAAEQWKSDAAGAGSMFSKLMVPAITFMQLMFYGFSPLILIFALFAGEKSIGLIAKYMMFGVWTVSWLPFAAVIQMYIQNQVIDRVSELGKLSPNGITLSNTPDFYDMVSTNLGLASDLLAATPMMSFALLSGSAMAMTSMAGRWGGRDYTDEKSMSPPAMSNGALVQNAPVVQQSQMGSQFSGASMPTLSVASSAGSGIKSAWASQTSAQDNLQKQISLVQDKANSHDSSMGFDESRAAAFTSAHQNADSARNSLAKSLQEKTGISEQSAFKLAGSIGAGINEAGFKAGLSAEGASTDQVSKAMDWASSHGSDIGASQDATRQLSNQMQQAAKFSYGEKNSTGKKESDGVTQSIATSHAATDSFTKESSQSSNFAVGFQGKVNELAGQILRSNNQGASNMADAVMGGYKDSSSPFAKYAAQANANAGMISDAGGGPTSSANVALGGMLLALSDAAANGDKNASNALSGMMQRNMPDSNAGSNGNLASPLTSIDKPGFESSFGSTAGDTAATRSAVHGHANHTGVSVSSKQQTATDYTQTKALEKSDVVQGEVHYNGMRQTDHVQSKIGVGEEAVTHAKEGGVAGRASHLTGISAPDGSVNTDKTILGNGISGVKNLMKPSSGKMPWDKK